MAHQYHSHMTAQCHISMTTAGYPRCYSYTSDTRMVTAAAPLQ